LIIGFQIGQKASDLANTSLPIDSYKVLVKGAIKGIVDNYMATKAKEQELYFQKFFKLDAPPDN